MLFSNHYWISVYFYVGSSSWFWVQRINIEFKGSILTHISNISINGGKFGGSININEVDLFSPSEEKVIWQRLCPYWAKLNIYASEND